LLNFGALDRAMSGQGALPTAAGALRSVQPLAERWHQNRRPRPDHGDKKFDRPFSISGLSEELWAKVGDGMMG